MSETSDTYVRLNGYVDVPEDRVQDVRDALPIHVALTRAEPGCLSFVVEEDQNCPGRFLVSEVFVDRAAFEAHQTRTRASDWFQITQGLARHYVIEGAGEEQG